MSARISDEELLQTLPISQRLRLHLLNSDAKKMLALVLRMEHETGRKAAITADDGRRFMLTRHAEAVL
jgi:hypothetical protein